VNLIGKALATSWIQLIEGLIGHMLVLSNSFDYLTRARGPTQLMKGAQDWIDPPCELWECVVLHVTPDKSI
jgi:hypothetical protein